MRYIMIVRSLALLNIFLFKKKKEKQNKTNKLIGWT